MVDNEQIEITIVIIPSEKQLYISEENTSGCKYNYKSKKSISEILEKYLSAYHCEM